MSWLLRALPALLLTLAVECGLAGLIFRRRAVAAACLWANLLTNPALNLLLCAWRMLFYATLPGYYGVLTLLEVLAVAAEAWAYRAALGWRWKNALGVSLGLNAASYLAGVVLGPWLWMIH